MNGFVSFFLFLFHWNCFITSQCSTTLIQRIILSERSPSHSTMHLPTHIVQKAAPSFTFATPESGSVVQLERNRQNSIQFIGIWNFITHSLTIDRLHSKNPWRRARHSSGTDPSVRFKHSRGNTFSCIQIIESHPPVNQLFSDSSARITLLFCSNRFPADTSSIGLACRRKPIDRPIVRLPLRMLGASLSLVRSSRQIALLKNDSTQIEQNRIMFHQLCQSESVWHLMCRLTLSRWHFERNAD